MRRRRRRRRYRYYRHGTAGHGTDDARRGTERKRTRARQARVRPLARPDQVMAAAVKRPEIAT